MRSRPAHVGQACEQRPEGRPDRRARLGEAQRKSRLPLATPLRLATAAVAAQVMGHVHRVRVARLVVLRATAGGRGVPARLVAGVVAGARRRVARPLRPLLVQPRMLRPELVGVLGLEPVGERSVLLQ